MIIIVRLQNTQNLLYYCSNITRCLSCYITSKDLILSAQVQIRFFDLVRHTCDTPSVHNKIWYHSPSFLTLVWSYLFSWIQKTFVSTKFGAIRYRATSIYMKIYLVLLLYNIIWITRRAKFHLLITEENVSLFCYCLHEEDFS